MNFEVVEKVLFLVEVVSAAAVREKGALTSWKDRRANSARRKKMSFLVASINLMKNVDGCEGG